MVELNAGDYQQIVTDDVSTSPGHETVLSTPTTHDTDVVTLTVFTTSHNLKSNRLLWLGTYT